QNLPLRTKGRAHKSKNASSKRDNPDSSTHTEQCRPKAGIGTDKYRRSPDRLYWRRPRRQRACAGLETRTTADLEIDFMTASAPPT
ncbi:MAG: hypothetical protein WA416_12410, partial [Candidatus Sulfotelmatobacter sp.]